METAFWKNVKQLIWIFLCKSIGHFFERKLLLIFWLKIFNTSFQNFLFDSHTALEQCRSTLFFWKFFFVVSTFLNLYQFNDCDCCNFFCRWLFCSSSCFFLSKQMNPKCNHWFQKKNKETDNDDEKSSKNAESGIELVVFIIHHMNTFLSSVVLSDVPWFKFKFKISIWKFL